MSRDRVELALSPMGHVPITGLRQALKFQSGPEASQEQDVADSRNHLRATLPEGEGELEANSDKESITANTPPNRQETGNTENEEDAQDLQEGDGNSPTREGETGNQEYEIDKLMDHGYDHENLILKVRWYGYTLEEATWEPVEQLPRSTIVSYFGRKQQPLPSQIAHAQVG